MRAVCRDEIDQRLRMLEMLHQVRPARVGLDPGVASLGVEVEPRSIERWNAGITAACEIEHSQIERRAEQVVAQGLRDKLVDLVADRAGHTAHDGACCILRRRTAASKSQWIEERRDQAQLL